MTNDARPRLTLVDDHPEYAAEIAPPAPSQPSHSPSRYSPRGATELDPPCPVDRLPRRRRNKLCIAVITLGTLNFLVYTLMYAALGGDAHNGYRNVTRTESGTVVSAYYLGGHYIRSLAGQERPVSRGIWIYSYLHSISVLLTSGAMIISMLVLARPDMIATMRDGWMSGRTLVTILGTLVVLATCVATFLFTWDFVAQLSDPD